MPKTLDNITQGAFKLAAQILGQGADAEDALQDAVAIAISHPSAPKSSSADFKAWFYSVVRNKSLDKLREHKRKNHQDYDDQQGLSLLPVQQREIVLLKDYHQMSYLEIAQVLDIPKGTVMSSLHRARLALRILLTKVAGDK